MRIFSLYRRKSLNMHSTRSISTTPKLAYSSSGASLPSCTTPWTPNLFEVGTTSGAWEDLEWQSVQRTGLNFHFIPGTVTLEEVESRAIEFGLYLPLRVVHEFQTRHLCYQAVLTLRDCLESNPQKLGGVISFRGTRFSVSQFLAELADSDAVQGIADEFEVERTSLQTFLHAFAVFFDRPTSSR
jgi:uncharacterized protein (DUF433 family)